MTFLEFNQYSAELIKSVTTMRDTKGKEYAGPKDRFDNFNRLADRLNLPRETVWLVYFTKHMDAIESYIKNGREFSTESVQGRITDAITYLTLLGGMLKENKDNQEKQLDMQALLDLPSPVPLPCVIITLQDEEEALS